MSAIVPLHSMILEGDHDAPVLVLLHGRGSDERDLFPLGRMLHPEATIVSVRAPFPAAPWGYGPGYAWYRYIGGTTPEPESFEWGQQSLTAFLETLSERFEGVRGGIVLGGFSQGGTTALGQLLRHPDSVRGVMVCSGFLADHPTVAVTPTTVGETPIFWGHGTADQAIPHHFGAEGQAALRAAGARLTAHSYEGMGHTIGSAEVADLKAWLAAID
ncbi:MAG TPA: dienelactone hydrolase family protein [Gemmatimonadales bacterium]|nr:dienelactone hydrolase family protein [Gemmatimonadales bacterium]